MVWGGGAVDDGKPVAAALGTPTQIFRISFDCISSKQRTGCPLHSHPTPTQTYPEIQQPPPSADGQLTAFEGQAPTPPPQVAPLGQHAICSASESDTFVQYDPSAQHLSGEPMPEQLSVPEGHAALFSRIAKTSAARFSKSSSDS